MPAYSFVLTRAPMPNLDNLRKQAKQFLRWHRERYYPVAAEIRAALPKFRDLSDVQVLAASFKLSDAQEVVARRLGYENWQALKTGALAMPISKKTAPTKPVLTATEAMLYVSDFERSRDYYTKLGFVLEFSYGDPPFFGLLKRDRARLCIRLVAEPVFVSDIREQEQLLSAAITLDSATDIKELFREFHESTADFFQKLKTEPWGARNFIIRDPDGNLVLFAAPSGGEKAAT